MKIPRHRILKNKHTILKTNPKKEAILKTKQKITTRTIDKTIQTTVQTTTTETKITIMIKIIRTIIKLEMITENTKVVTR